MPAKFSHASTAHNLAATPVFFGLPAAAASYGWRSWPAGQPPGFAIYCAAAAVTMPVTTALAGAGFSQSSRLGGYGGLFQRASIITGFAWLTAVSARAPQRTLPGTAGTSLYARPQSRSAQGIATAQIGGSGAYERITRLGFGQYGADSPRRPRWPRRRVR